MLFVKIDFLFFFVFEGRYERSWELGFREGKKIMMYEFKMIRTLELQ
ncbi:MAG: hypothetical protein ACI8YP_003487 [Algoriphagus sp.]|jgi:hypothetical protein